MMKVKNRSVLDSQLPLNRFRVLDGRGEWNGVMDQAVLSFLTNHEGKIFPNLLKTFLDKEQR